MFAQELRRVQKDKVTLYPAKGVCRPISALMIAGQGVVVKKKHNSRYGFRSESTRCGVYVFVEFVEFVEFIGFVEATAQAFRLKTEGYKTSGKARIKPFKT
jgi:hypothetical protein